MLLNTRLECSAPACCRLCGGCLRTNLIPLVATYVTYKSNVYPWNKACIAIVINRLPCNPCGDTRLQQAADSSKHQCAMRKVPLYLTSIQSQLIPINSRSVTATVPNMQRAASWLTRARPGPCLVRDWRAMMFSTRLPPHAAPAAALSRARLT